LWGGIPWAQGISTIRLVSAKIRLENICEFSRLQMNSLRDQRRESIRARRVLIPPFWPGQGNRRVAALPSSLSPSSAGFLRPTQDIINQDNLLQLLVVDDATPDCDFA